MGNSNSKVNQPAASASSGSNSEAETASNSTSSSEDSQLKKVVIVGGGPVGMMFALLLSEYANRKKIGFDINIFESRWKDVDGKVVWKGSEDGNNRRKQVVTIQSNVWSLFPSHVKKALFGAEEGEDYREMWPLGPDSPKNVGFPRNVPVEVIEDKLLSVLQSDPILRGRQPTLHCRRVGKETMKEILDKGVDYLVLADGGASRAEGFLNDALREINGELGESFKLFGQKIPFAQDPEMRKKDVVLGVQLEAERRQDLYGLSMSESMAVTVSQNVLLLNPLAKKKGFLNFWLTEEESQQAFGITDEGGYAACNQRSPCLFSKAGSGEFRCPSHNTVFVPSAHRESPLWRKIENALKLYGINEDCVRSFTKFQLGPYSERQSFYAETQLPNGTLRAFLIGDAAMTVNFRAGRGLNTGLKGAISLARSLTLAEVERDNRPAFFVRHHGMMSMLQKREVEIRSLGMMEETETDGNVGTRDEFKRRLKNSSRIFRRDRLPESVEVPDNERLEQAVDGVSPFGDGFICDLFKSGAWNTGPVGGLEVQQALPEPLWHDSDTEYNVSKARFLDDPELEARLPQSVYRNYGEEACDSFRAARFAIEQLAQEESELGNVLSRGEKERWDELTGQKKRFVEKVLDFAQETTERLKIVRNRLEGTEGSVLGKTLQECYEGFDRNATIEKIDHLKELCRVLRENFDKFREQLEAKYGKRKKCLKIIRNCAVAAAVVCTVAAVVVAVAPVGAVAGALMTKCAVDAAVLALGGSAAALAVVGTGTALALTKDETDKAIEYLKNIDNRLMALRNQLSSVRSCVAPLDMVTREECVRLITRIIEESDKLVKTCAQT